ncbi:MAG: metal-sulfur cluster assembly factor [Thermoflexales bacterium]|nr:metal-sulfur cluster assembly factor [Thermoflexales bacterium]
MIEQVEIQLEEQIKAALREVYDPELGMNVVELGLIRKIAFQPDLVEITMILTTPFCPLAPQIFEQVRQAVEKTAKLPARVTMGMEMWEPTMMEDGGASDWGLY